MQEIEPHYNWRHIYIAEEDRLSPFYGRAYSEFEFTDQIYNFVIHPQWDNIGSPTLFIKIIYADYASGVAVIEMIGEWNDAINNDIMFLKRDIIDELIFQGINKFVLLGENVLNFHYSDDSYYEEWFEDLNDGWIVALNFHEHVLSEFQEVGVDNYFLWGGQLNEFEWRRFAPSHLIDQIEGVVNRRLA